MQRSLHSRVRRALVGTVGVVAVTFASLSVVPSPALGDTNEGGVVVNPANRARQATISAGARHSCAILGANKTVWCWGDNSSGQLGNGTTAPATGPVKVVGLSGATAVSAGGDHTCALLAGGSARCWGGNGNGQLGNGSLSPSPSPSALNSNPSFTSISAGDGFSCGTTAGQVLCWGSNNNGQLGFVGGGSITYPVAVPLPGAPVIVSAGRLHACSVLQGGNAYCWGNNSWGQLGRGNVSGQQTPGLVNAFNVDAITVGDAHTCAIAAGGTKCWGNNDWGQLGNGVPGFQPSPTNIANGNTLEQAISAGVRHACGRQGLKIRCWGSDSDGQLGNGASGSFSVPFDVVGYSSGEIPAITAGAHHTCAQFQLGQVDCFGDNSANQMGRGAGPDVLSPARVIDFPGTPTDTDATIGYGQITLSWTPPANTGNLPINSYRIYDAEGTLDVQAPGNATSYTLTGLNPGQTYSLRLAAVNELGEGQAVQRTPVTMPTQPVISVNDVSYLEGNSGTKNMTFTLTRSGPANTAVSVKAATQNANAVAPGDFTAKAPTLVSFAAGQTSKTFVVTTKGDLLTEDDEAFAVVLSSPVGAVVYDSSGDGMLLNDDAGEKPSYSISGATMAEGNSLTSNMTFTITRHGSTAVAGSVKYATQTIGQASAPEDFTAKAPTIMSFPVGATTKTFTVAIKGDLVAEPDEYFQVVLSAPVNGDLETFPFDYGLIQNDDSSAPTTVAINDVASEEGNGFSKNITFTVTRSGNLAGTTQLKFITQNGTAIAPGDYTAKALTSLTFNAGETTKTIVVTMKSDSVSEPDEQFSVLLSTIAGGTISDDTGVATIINDDGP